MNELDNDLLIRALLSQPTERTPIWMMRQAGRYLPEYLELRRQAPSFMDFCKSPDLAAKATIQPIDRFGFDGAIIFSDILTIPDALGCDLQFINGQGPVINKPIRCAADVSALPSIDIRTCCDYVYEAIDRAKQLLAGRVPLIGFSGSPWTIACYMIEGSASRDFMLSRRLLQSHPETVHALLAYLTELIISYLCAQIEAGAQVIMLFDSWGGLLSPQDYKNVSLFYMKKIIAAVKLATGEQTIPQILFSKGAAGYALTEMANSGADAIGLDWTVDLKTAFNAAGDKVALQGNLDPAYLFADEDRLQGKIISLLEAAKGHSGYVFNLGHGINKDTPIASVEKMVRTVQEYRFNA